MENEVVWCTSRNILEQNKEDAVLNIRKEAHALYELAVKTEDIKTRESLFKASEHEYERATRIENMTYLMYFKSIIQPIHDMDKGIEFYVDGKKFNFD